MSKLVRDDIPKIIRARGEEPDFTNIPRGTAAKREYLIEKLREETTEFEETPIIEELADILEVIHTIAEDYDFTLKDLEIVRVGKRTARGGFEYGRLLHGKSKTYEDGKGSEHRG